MRQNKTASGLLAQIENDFFKGVSLAETSLLEGEDFGIFPLILDKNL